MNPIPPTTRLLATLALAVLAGCLTPGTGDVLSGSESQLRMRSMQTRSFDVSDKLLVMRAVISTLQDIGFMIEQADETLGTVTARKFVSPRNEGGDLRMTVTVRPGDGGKMLVRANAEFNRNAVEDPEAYQNFFTSLSKTLFLNAQQVK